MSVERVFLGPGRHTSTDDADNILPRFRERGSDNAPYDRADRKESIFILTVLPVVEHEVVRIALEEHPDLIKADTMLGAIRPILLGVPLHPHPVQARPLAD